MDLINIFIENISFLLVYVNYILYNNLLLELYKNLLLYYVFTSRKLNIEISIKVI